MHFIYRFLTSAILLLTLTLHPVSVLSVKESNTSSPSDKQSADKERKSNLAEQVDQTIEKLESIRQLKATSNINASTKTRQQLRDYLKDQLDTHFEPGLIEAEGQLFELLGLVPPNFNYRDSILELLTQQVAGFYDPKSKRLYLLEEIPTTFHSHALAHEIFHAIQDQHFDIERLSNPIPKTHHNQDLILARKALLEGDAMVVTFDHFLHESGMLPFETNNQTYRSITDIPQFRQSIKKRLRPSAKPILQMEGKPGAGSPFGSLASQFPGRNSLQDVPAIIRRPLLFPYLKGLRFVLSLKEPGDWQTLNRLYRIPPDSTEQILHPDKYVEQDVPTSIFFNPFDKKQRDKRFVKSYENVLGEFMLKIILNTHMSSNPEHIPSSGEAARGWDGDRLKMYRYGKSKDGYLISHASIWDSRRDAEQFYNAMRQVLETHFGVDSTGKAGKHICNIGHRDSRTHSICLDQWKGKVLFTDLIAPSASLDLTKTLHENAVDSVWTEPLHRTIRRWHSDAKEQSDQTHQKPPDSE